MSKTKGFTLIELLIVVVIIGILAAISIPKFANTKSKAVVTAMRSDPRRVPSPTLEDGPPLAWRPRRLCLQSGRTRGLGRVSDASPLFNAQSRPRLARAIELSHLSPRILRREWHDAARPGGAGAAPIGQVIA